MMRRVICSFFVVWMSFLGVLGQDEQPLPDLDYLLDIQAIEPLQRIGMGKPNKLLWSKQGDKLIVGTQAGI